MIVLYALRNSWIGFYAREWGNVVQKVTINPVWIIDCQDKSRLVVNLRSYCNSPSIRIGEQGVGWWKLVERGGHFSGWNNKTCSSIGYKGKEIARLKDDTRHTSK